jgi:hypothetical protein
VIPVKKINIKKIQINEQFSVFQKGIIAIILLIIVIAGLGWVNFQFAKNNPGGNDFLVHYVGTRALLFEGLSPYSDQVAVRIQTAAYGHPAGANEHELRVAYPLYSVFLFAPFSIINNYSLARAIWMTVLEIGLIAMAFLAFDLADWKPNLLIQGLILLFSVLWYHAVRGLVNGNAVILIALMITAVFLLIKHQADSLAGILLALTTIKPHLVLMLILYIIIWAIYQKRWTLIGWFSASLAVLVSLGWLLIPNWVLQNIWEILRYPDYNPAGTLAEALGTWMPGIQAQLKWGIAGVLGLVAGYETWKARHARQEHFLWTGLLILVISQWIGIQTDPGNFILLFPVVIITLAVISKKRAEDSQVVVAVILGILFFGLWLLFVVTIERSYQPVQSPVMFLPLPGICLVGLYWIRYWMTGRLRTLWGETE